MDSSSQEDSKMSREEEGLLRVNQINSGIILPMVIKTALELDLFEIMAKSPGRQFSAFDLASSLPKQSPETPALIERLLRFLASQSILTSKVVTDEHGDSKTLYGMTHVSNYYVRKEDGTSHASALLLIYDKVFVDCWYHLKDAVVEGGVPFDKAHGVNAFEYPAKDNRFNKVFNKCMYDETRIVMKMILEKYKGFEGVKELTDVGGGLGANLELIVSMYPDIKGINFDLPHVIKDAPPYPGVEHVGGDMFASVPKGDIIFMKWILHDWGDNYCIKLLKNCWAALPECGKVVVVEAIMPDPEHISATDEVSKTAVCGDLIMLIANPGGKERTVKEYNALAKEAGFTSLDISSNDVVGGDMFQSVPKGDVIFMKWVLHDWGDDYCIKLLTIIPEQQLPENGKTNVISNLDGDMVMLAINPSGKERTVREYEALAIESGFASSKIVCPLVCIQ